MASQTISTKTVLGYLVQPTNDAKQIAVVFRVDSGMTGYGFSPEDFAVFAAKVLEVAKDGKSPDVEAGDPVHTFSLPTDIISFEPDPAKPTSATVNSRIGRLRLAMSVDAGSLMRSFKQYLDNRKAPRSNGQ
jgi:hypothetical protein